MRTATLLLLACSAHAQSFEKALNSATVATASNPVRNTGQAVHIMTLIVPGATADVTGFVARIEASYDYTSWVPISQDVTTARTTGTFAFAVIRANGVYPAVRVNLTTAAAGKAITAYYSSAVYPIGQFVFDGSRFLSSATAPFVHSWVLCNGEPCSVQDDVTNWVITTGTYALSKCFVVAKTAPTGAPITLDIRRNGTSIFTVPGRPTIPAGSTAVQTTTGFANPLVGEGDVLTVHILSIGSGDTGANVTLTCKTVQ